MATKLAISAVFSCKAIIKFVLLLHGNDFMFALQADGTYRLLFVGWALIVVLFTWNQWVPSEQRVVHHGQPVLLSLCFTESKKSYEHSFQVSTSTDCCFVCLCRFFRRVILHVHVAQIFADLPKTFAADGVIATQIVPVACGIDCAVYIANALYAVWPLIPILLCWAHIARKFKDKKMEIRNTQNEDVVEEHVRAMHHTVAREQFVYLWAFISVYWTTQLSEGRYAESFHRSYVGSPTGPATWRSSRFMTAAGRGGITCVSNTIESFNRSAKVALAMHALYASLSFFFNHNLPRLMTCAGAG
jgi:uncharacterized membrane protein (DUF106 family)